LNKNIVQEVVANKTDVGKRLDIFVSETDSISRSAAQKLAANEQVLVNGAPRKSNYKISLGDRVILKQIEKGKTVLDIPIIFEDENILVIDKPAGITVHPAAGEKDLTLAEILPQPVFIVHRLDKGTSGVMVFARNEKAAEYLKKQFHDRKVTKVYKALVSGDISEDSGSIDISLGRSLTARGNIVPTENGKGAVTSFKVIERYTDYTFVEAMPKTGRTHQIRTHFAAIGHPLYGDVRYGGPTTERIFLHAYSLSFMNPKTKKKQEFISPLTESSQAILKHLL
jgi:23S rRNA pseudouridine1911/1915/1917 synthase